MSKTDTAALAGARAAIVAATLPGRRGTNWAQGVAECNAWKVAALARPDQAAREAAKWGRHASLVTRTGTHDRRRADRSAALVRAHVRARRLAVERAFPGGEYVEGA